MKFFKFNLTHMGVILHIITIHINLRYWQPFVMNVSQNRKMKKVAYFSRHWLDLVQIWCREVFLDSKSKINNKIFMRRHSDVKLT